VKGTTSLTRGEEKNAVEKKGAGRTTFVLSRNHSGGLQFARGKECAAYKVKNHVLNPDLEREGEEKGKRREGLQKLSLLEEGGQVGG